MSEKSFAKRSELERGLLHSIIGGDEGFVDKLWDPTAYWVGSLQREHQGPEGKYFIPYFDNLERKRRVVIVPEATRTEFTTREAATKADYISLFAQAHALAPKLENLLKEHGIIDLETDSDDASLGPELLDDIYKADSEIVPETIVDPGSPADLRKYVRRGKIGLIGLIVGLGIIAASGFHHNYTNTPKYKTAERANVRYLIGKDSGFNNSNTRIEILTNNDLS